VDQRLMVSTPCSFSPPVKPMHSSVDTPDPELITAILGGEQDRFEELVKRYQKMVYGVA
jgi:hypothetical protein